MEDIEDLENFVAGEKTLMNSFVCLFLITGAAWFGGFLISLTRGYQFPNIPPFNGVKTQPLSKEILLPPLIGMIIFGILMRNFGGDYLENYNDGWGTYIRMICLSVILLEGGFELEFSAEGALSLVILLTLVPVLLGILLILF